MEPMERPAPKDAPAEIPDDEVLYELADLFRVFGDSTRIKILYALHDQELCVQDIAAAVGLSQSAVSHQLRVLKGLQAGAVPPGRQDRLLRPGRRPRAQHPLAGDGAYRRMTTFGKDRYIMKKTYKIDVDCAQLRQQDGGSRPKDPRRQERHRQLYDPENERGV